MKEEKRLFLSKVVFLITLAASLRLFITAKWYQSLPLNLIFWTIYIYAIAPALHTGRIIGRQGDCDIRNEKSKYIRQLSLIVLIHCSICLAFTIIGFSK